MLLAYGSPWLRSSRASTMLRNQPNGQPLQGGLRGKNEVIFGNETKERVTNDK